MKLVTAVKCIYYCPIEIIKGITDKGQLQYLTKLKGPQVGNSFYCSVSFVRQFTAKVQRKIAKSPIFEGLPFLY